MSVRLAVAGTPVMDEADAVKAWERDPEGLDEQCRTAIRFADALMTSPGDLDDDLVTDMRRLFTETQIVELTLKTLKFNMQKATVAAGHDRWITEDTFAATGFGHNGWFAPAPG